LARKVVRIVVGKTMNVKGGRFLILIDLISII
jgi:hypothetical protein